MIAVRRENRIRKLHSTRMVLVSIFFINLIFLELNKNEKGRKWVIDGSKLTIFDVRKGIEGTGDNAVYQCKAENKHGYLWANFYLNLLGN